ncbi:MAG: lipoate--protein ligase [Oscillospiraceae bacterium]|nr:lipoate--protein ligase [Oscillospiraceae bacterium]
MIYLETGSLDPCFNLAFEEYVLTRRRDGDYLILWQNQNTVVVGNNQITEAEINRPWIEAHGVKVVRRATGGGAVYHDLGNLNYSFLTDYRPEDQLSMERFTRPVVRALRALGADAEATGRNDILVAGKKVSGTAQKIAGGRILHHGTLLFDSDPEAIASALRADPQKFQSKVGKSVRSRVGNIRDALPEDMTLRRFWDYLKAALSAGGCVSGALTEAEKREVDRLRREKYETWAWTYGRSPAAEVHASRRYAGGTLEFYASLSGDVIRSIGFYGDFLSKRSLDPLCRALEGVPFTPEAVGAVLARFAVPDYFGSITAEEVLALLFAP